MTLTANVQTAESNLIAVIREAIAALQRVGTSELNHALADLDGANNDAITRLEEAARRVRASFAGVTARADGIAASLRAEVFGEQQAEQPKSDVTSDLITSDVTSDLAPAIDPSPAVAAVKGQDETAALASPTAPPDADLNDLIERTARPSVAACDKDEKGGTQADAASPVPQETPPASLRTRQEPTAANGRSKARRRP